MQKAREITIDSYYMFMKCHNYNTTVYYSGSRSSSVTFIFFFLIIAKIIRTKIIEILLFN